MKKLTYWLIGFAIAWIFCSIFSKKTLDKFTKI